MLQYKDVTDPRPRGQTMENNTINILNKPHYRIVFIGKTGCGKSTLINMIFNILINMEYTDERQVAVNVNCCGGKLPCNIPLFNSRQPNSIKSTESQTQKVEFYSLKGKDKKVTLIDTPGLLDTKGLEIDAQHIKKIVASVQKLESINAICYVHKGSDDKAELSLKYQVHELQGMLPKEFQENFFVCFTYSSGAQISAKVLLQELKLLTPANYINLDLACFTPFSKLSFSNDADADEKEEELTTQVSNWDKARKKINGLFDKIKIVTALKPRGILDLHIKKECIKQLIQTKAVLIIQNDTLKNLLQQEKFQLEQKINKPPQNTEGKIEKSRIIKVKASRKAHREVNITPKKLTQCLLCLSNCHIPCHLDGIYLKGSIQMQNCACIIQDTKCCKVCKCAAEFHRHTQTKIEEYEEIFDQQLIDFYYDQSQDPNESKISLNETIENYNKLIQDKKTQIERKTTELNRLIGQIAYMQIEVKKIAMVSGEHDTLLEYIEQYQQLLKKQGKESKGLDDLKKHVNKQKEEYGKAIGMPDQEKQKIEKENKEIEKEIMAQCETIKYLAELEINLKEEEKYIKQTIKGKNGEEFEVS